MNPNDLSPNGTAPKAAEPTTSTDSPSLVDVAGQLDGLVAQLESLIPDLTPHDVRQVKRVAAAAKFANDLLPPTITAVTVPPAPKGLFNVEAARAALEYRDQLRPLALRLRALTKALEYSIHSKLSDSAEEALQTYGWAKRAERGPNGPALAPYVEEMRKAVRKAANRRPKPAEETPAEGPQGGQSFLAHRPKVKREGPLPESFYAAADDDLAQSHG